MVLVANRTFSKARELAKKFNGKAVEFDKFCVFIKRSASLRYEPLIELYNYVKDRIYIFIDNAIENEKGIIK